MFFLEETYTLIINSFIIVIITLKIALNDQIQFLLTYLLQHAGGFTNGLLNFISIKSCFSLVFSLLKH